MGSAPGTSLQHFHVDQYVPFSGNAQCFWPWKRIGWVGSFCSSQNRNKDHAGPMAPPMLNIFSTYLCLCVAFSPTKVTWAAGLGGMLLRRKQEIEVVFTMEKITAVRLSSKGRCDVKET